MVKRAEIQPADISGPLPLSFAQQRLWLVDQLQGSSTEYNMPFAMQIDGNFSLEAAERALGTIVQRHEVLRTVFVSEAEQARQEISSDFDLALKRIDLTALDHHAQQQEVQQLVDEDNRTAFDLSRDLMVRATYIQLSESSGVLIFNMHHIASDGWSMAVLVREFGALYSAYVQNQPNPLSPLPIQYVDYTCWQHDWLKGEAFETQLNYWCTQLADLPLVHNLPLDAPRPLAQTYRGASHAFTLDPALTRRLEQLCQSQGATLFMGLHAAISVLLARYSNETDIVVGTPVANREQAEVAGLIGFFVNSLVLRSDLSANPTFVDLLNQSKSMLLDAYKHQQVPFEKIVEQLQPERSLSHSPLFQVMMVLQNNESASAELPDVTLTPLKGAQAMAKYDLTLSIREPQGDEDEGLSMSWLYNTDLFNANTISTMAGHFEYLLGELLEVCEDTGVLSVEMLNQAERDQQWLQWQTPAVSNAVYDAQTLCIHHMFEAHTDGTAILFADEVISYETLNRQANQLAHYLIDECQVTPETLVGICFERSPQMIVALLAVLKAGGAYVPLDPDYPAARLTYIMDDAGLDTVLTQHHLPEPINFGERQVLAIDSPQMTSLLAGKPQTNPQAAVMPSNLAYVIYTSGTTGKPKGVLQTHENVVQLMQAIPDEYQIDSNDRWVLYHSICFDFSVWELWGALAFGGAVVIPDKACVRDPLAFARLLERQQVTVFNQIPGAFFALAETVLANDIELPSLRYVFVGGDKLNMAKLDAWWRRFGETQPRLVQVYGITETAVLSTAQTLAMADDNTRSVIGRSFKGRSLYVLNSQMKGVPAGCTGELYVGGSGLARGYLNRPELTAERFVDNPFDDGRLYRTGDLVCWHQSETHGARLQYLDRVDHQVQIRGFRIELGEIEQQLMALNELDDVLVLAKADNAGDHHLVAYVVNKAQAEQPAAQQNEYGQWLRQQLSEHLPEHMLPSVYVVMDELPLTSTGKFDRRALPEPDMSLHQGEYAAPRSELEKALVAIWQQVLDVPTNDDQSSKIGIEDNFFALGGHSLSATRVAALVRAQLDISVPLKTLFSHQSIADLAAVLSESADGEGAERPALGVAYDENRRSEGLVTSFAQQRLWLLDQIDGGSVHYNMPAALQFSGDLNVAALQQAFSAIVARHESLRSVFEAGLGDEPVQRIREAQAVDIPLVDLTAQAGTDRQHNELKRLMAEHGAYAFDLANDLMLQLKLVKLDDAEYVLLFNMHHIASDGWSMAVLVKEFGAIYSAIVNGEANPMSALPALPIQYADYAHWQRNWLQGEVLEQQLAYWREQLAGLPMVHGLPLDRPRPTVQTYRGANHTSELTAKMSGELDQLCQSQGATLFMGLHAAISVLLARYSNETDIVVGTAVANREQAEVADLIGFFVNSLVLRSDLSANPSFVDLLNQSKSMLLDAYEHQQVPFEKLVEQLQPERSLSHSPLFQVMVVLQNNEAATLDLPDVTLTPLGGADSMAKYDLTLSIVEPQDDSSGLSLHWLYNADLFNADTISSMAGHFEYLLGELLGVSDDTGVLSVEMLNQAERDQQWSQWQTPAVSSDVYDAQTLCIHHMFEAHTDGTAILFADEVISYETLNRQANQLAHYLIDECQVTPETLVGICFERSPQMIVALLAVLKAGGAYVPLDPDYPAARLTYIMDDAGLDTVLTQHHLPEPIDFGERQVLAIDSPQMTSLLAGKPHTNPQTAVLPSNLAYVIYTSGTTGKPKGVLQTHENVVQLMQAIPDEYQIDSNDRWVLYHSICFDFSVWELWGALAFGGAVVVPDKVCVRDPLAFARLLERQQVTVFNQIPGAFFALAEAVLANDIELPSLRYVFVGGDKLNMARLDPWWQRFGEVQPRLVQVYGITESAVLSTAQTLSMIDDSTRSVIGRSFKGKSLYVLNSQMKGVPAGCTGELYVGGFGLGPRLPQSTGIDRRAFYRQPV